MDKPISSVKETEKHSINLNRKFFSATHEEIEKGLTTDIYFVRAQEILRYLSLDSTIVTAEIFPREEGVFIGTQEVYNLLKDKKIKLWSLEEGESFRHKDTGLFWFSTYTSCRGSGYGKVRTDRWGRWSKLYIRGKVVWEKTSRDHTSYCNDYFGRYYKSGSSL